MLSKLVTTVACTAISFSLFADAPKGAVKTDAKDTPSETKTEGAVVKWFHFNGDASDPDQLTDPSLYSSESTPTCSSTVIQYRCDIKILSNDDQSQPDLSQAIQDTRYRSNP